MKGSSSASSTVVACMKKVDTERFVSPNELIISVANLLLQESRSLEGQLTCPDNQAIPDRCRQASSCS